MAYGHRCVPVSYRRFFYPYQTNYSIITKSMKQILLIILLALQAIWLSAQEKADTTFVFRFVPKEDMFYIPYKGNNAELQRLCLVLNENKELLQTGKMYVAVSSYIASGKNMKSDTQLSYLRNSRVKSELITQLDLKESHFVTDRHIRGPYKGKSNVVVVVVPASAEKVAQIAGEQAAETVRAYYREIGQGNEELTLAEQQARETTEQEASARQTKKERPDADQQNTEQVAAKQKPLGAESSPSSSEPPTKSYTLSIRANLLSWATLTPNLGVEWRINRQFGVMVNGSWTSWSWDHANRRYALWKVSPEVRYYMGTQKRGYLGAMYQIGQFNYKFSKTGRQGDYQGGSITGGYQLPLKGSLSLDFHAGVGYTHAAYDKYKVIEGTRVRQGSDTKNYWGINQFGVTLVWKIIK